MTEETRRDVDPEAQAAFEREIGRKLIAGDFSSPDHPFDDMPWEGMRQWYLQGWRQGQELYRRQTGRG